MTQAQRRLQARISDMEREIVEYGKEAERCETDADFVRFLLHNYWTNRTIVIREESKVEG